MGIKLIISEILSALTLVSGIIVGVLVLTYVTTLFFKPKKEEIYHTIMQWFGRNSLWMAFIVVLTATLGSLFYSEIMGFSPCGLCWYQRILMYPMTLIFLVAMVRKDYDIFYYTTLISLVGIGFASYHYILQRMEYATACGIESCTTKYIFDYGYITIPMMALTAFILVIFLHFAYNYTGKG